MTCEVWFLVGAIALGMVLFGIKALRALLSHLHQGRMAPGNPAARR